MLPVMMQSWGGSLIYIEGRSARHFGYHFRVNPTLTSTDSITAPRHVGRFDQISSVSDYFRSFFNGANSYWPSACSNHRSMAVFKGKVYQGLNQISETGSELSIVRFDGSGLFVNGGNATYEARQKLNGPGFELLSPSGVNSDSSNLLMETRTGDCAFIVHNGVLFFYGQAITKDNAASDLWPQNGWDYSLETLADSRNRRRYFWASIDHLDRKTFGPTTTFTTNTFNSALNDEHLHMCDAISKGDDVYICNQIDVVKVAGGSGAMTLMDHDRSRATTRSMALWPSGGYSNGVAQGPSEVLVLEGSGFLKRLRPESQYPSGAYFYGDLSDVTIPPGIGQTRNRRSTDPWTTRILDGVDQPMRSCLLKNFDNQLHAFICTEASGVHHFINNGNSASGVSNWTDASSSLPDDMVRWDGNVYAAIDTVRNRMLVSYVTMGNIGVVGHSTQKTAGGGTYLYSYKDGAWTEIYTGAAGGTPRGLVPLANIGPFTTIPSGTNPEVFKCDDYAVMTYSLTDEKSRPVDVTIEYSINDGLNWTAARRFRSYDTRQPLGSGVTNLATNPTGIEYTFFWDYVNDVGFNRVEQAQLRVTPILKR